MDGAPGFISLSVPLRRERCSLEREWQLGGEEVTAVPCKFLELLPVRGANSLCSADRQIEEREKIQLSPTMCIVLIYVTALRGRNISVSIIPLLHER